MMNENQARLVASIDQEDIPAVLEALLASVIERADFCREVNDPGKLVNRVNDLIKDAKEEIDKAFVGEQILDIFREYKHLLGVYFSVDAVSEYDDQGGNYRCFNIDVQAEVSNDADVDDVISDEISDNCWSAELHGAITGDFSSSNYQDATMRVTRETLEPFLKMDPSEVSGKAVWAAIDAARQAEQKIDRPSQR
jgi:hypothetical protein